MPELEDQQLLAEFTSANSETAFAALVGRYVNLVYSTALRFSGNPQAAEEISQAVFIILARKAAGLGRSVVLSGWLYQTARLTASNYVKQDIRRQRREQEAYMQSTLPESTSDPAWQELSPLLDEAMMRLGQREREAVVLRFFKEQSMLEVAAALNIKEPAAQMRVGRALEKLRKYFARRGIASTTAIIGGAVSTNSVHAAPAGLADTISAAALAKGAVASASTLTLVKGALKIMAWTKVKTAVVVGIVGIVLAAGTTTVVVKEIHHHQNDEWQLGNIDGKFLERRPYRTVILPTRSAERSRQNGTGGGATIGDGRAYGINASIDETMRWAYARAHDDGYYYGAASPVRTILDTRIPTKRYDYFSNLPKGSKEALQLEIRKKFGLTAEYQTIKTNVLLLEVKYPNSAGLKRSKPHNDIGSNYQYGDIRANDQTMGNLAEQLENDLGIPVVDQTGLTNRYDFNLQWQNKPWRRNRNGMQLNRDNNPNLNELKQALTDQLGLELVPATAPIEMLVVEKAQ